MGQFDQLFSTIMSSKKMGGNYASRIPLGRHKLAIKKYFPKEAQKKGQGLIMECDFFVLESTTLQYGDTRNEPWFLGSDQYGYEADRSREFIVAVSEALGMTDAGDGTQLGEWLVSGALNGLVMICDVTQQFKKDGSTPKVDGKNNPIFKREWSGLTGQSAETIKAVAQAMTQFTPVPQVAAPVAPQQPQQLPAAFQPTVSPAQQTQVAFAAPVAPVAQQVAPAFGGFQAPAQPLVAPSVAPQANPLTQGAQGASSINDILATLRK